MSRRADQKDLLKSGVLRGQSTFIAIFLGVLAYWLLFLFRQGGILKLIPDRVVALLIALHHDRVPWPVC